MENLVLLSEVWDNISVNIDKKHKSETAEALVRVFDDNGLIEHDQVKMFGDFDRVLKVAIVKYQIDNDLVDDEEEDEDWD